MRRILILMAVLATGIGLGALPQTAKAGSLHTLSAPIAASVLIEKAGYWRRYCRRYGCGPDVVLPDADADADAGADVPAVIVLPPPRPLSCGEYHYWDGERCVDARYNNPYLGPR